MFCFPIVSGLFFPIATLDSDIVKAKGFHFPVAQAESTDPFMRRQFLRPDTSIYYGKEGYRGVMEKGKKEFVTKDSVTLNDENFLKGMETIYNYPGEFTGKNYHLKVLFSKMILLKRTILLIPFRYYTLCSGFWCIWYVSEKARRCRMEKR